MIKARPKYPTELYGNNYIDKIQKAVVICLIIPPTFPVDAAGGQHQQEMLSEWLDKWQQLFESASTGKVVGMIRQMTTAFWIKRKCCGND